MKIRLDFRQYIWTGTSKLKISVAVPYEHLVEMKKFKRPAMTVSKLFEYIIKGSFIPHKFRKQEIKCLLHSHFSCLDNVTK